MNASARSALLLSTLLACSSSADPTGGSGGGGSGGSGGAGGSAASPPAGACTYVNPFSKGGECKEYPSAAWTEDAAAADCASSVLGAPGTFAAGAACAFDAELGRCLVDDGTGGAYVLVNEGSDPSKCDGAKLGCEVFAGGTFQPGAPCSGQGTGGAGGGDGGVFVQPYLDCRDPLAGEPAGQGPGGQVCTWVLISGSTEEGRRFQDYASCDDVRTQRPYYGLGAEPPTPADDPRLADAAYMAEVAWAKEQVEASACVCCHSSALAPDGPSQWFIESPGIWLDSVADGGLAMLAGLAKSDALGAFPPEENNGFDRSTVGLPTTDVPRMQALLLGEWERRGYTVEQGLAVEPFGGPLVDQLAYVPQACPAGVGLSNGQLTWSGGGARYLYVLAADAANPGVPPNLDEPVGTRWLVEVPWTKPAFASGVTYGAVGGDLKQRVPATGAPAALVPGETYYLYVLKDIGVPIARCLFTA